MSPKTGVVAEPVKIEGYSGTSVEPGVIAADRTYAAGQGVGKVGPARSCLSLRLPRFEDPSPLELNGVT